MLTTSSCSYSGNLLPLQQSLFTSFMNEHILTRYVQMHCSLTHLKTHNFFNCTFLPLSLSLSQSLSQSVSLSLSSRSVSLSLSVSVLLPISRSVCLSFSLSFSVRLSTFLCHSIKFCRMERSI